MKGNSFLLALLHPWWYSNILHIREVDKGTCVQMECLGGRSCTSVCVVNYDCVFLQLSRERSLCPFACYLAGSQTHDLLPPCPFCQLINEFSGGRCFQVSCLQLLSLLVWLIMGLNFAQIHFFFFPERHGAPPESTPTEQGCFRGCSEHSELCLELPAARAQHCCWLQHAQLGMGGKICLPLWREGEGGQMGRKRLLAQGKRHQLHICVLCLSPSSGGDFSS